MMCLLGMILHYECINVGRELFAGTNCVHVCGFYENKTKHTQFLICINK